MPRITLLSKSVLATLVTISLSFCMVIPIANAQYVGTNGRIVYGSASGNLTVKPDGSDSHVFNAAASVCGRSMVYTPDGKNTAYAFADTGRSDSDIWMRNGLFSNEATRLTNDPNSNDCDPYFSPDGTKVAFTRQTGGHSEVFVVSINGTNLVQLTNNLDAVGKSSAMPEWKDDNSLFVLSGGRVVIISATQAGQTASQATVVSPQAGGSIGSFDVSPSEKSLVFCELNSGNKQIRTVNNSGGANSVIIKNGDAGIAGPCNPAFSPDGSKIVFVGRKSSLGSKDMGIYLADISGQSIVPLLVSGEQQANLASEGLQPFWSTNQAAFGPGQTKATPPAPGVANTGTVLVSAGGAPIAITLVIILGILATVIVYWIKVELKKDPK